MSKARNAYNKRRGCLFLIIDVLAVLAIMALCIFCMLANAKFMNARADVWAYKMRFEELSLCGLLFLSILLYFLVKEFLESRKKEKNFWKPKTWREEHSSKNFIEYAVFDNFGPAAYLVLLLFFAGVALFSRDELTENTIRRYNFMNIKIREKPLDAVDKVELGLESHRSKHSTRYNQFIKIYIGEKSYKLDTMKKTNITKFYDKYALRLPKGSISITGQIYTEKYLASRDLSDTRKFEICRFMYGHSN